ncbi:hypothetical protein K504DRAFT_465670, partial [Pleomassaria siparia CBS 279.74]
LFAQAVSTAALRGHGNKGIATLNTQVGTKEPQLLILAQRGLLLIMVCDWKGGRVWEAQVQTRLRYVQSKTHLFRLRIELIVKGRSLSRANRIPGEKIAYFSWVQAYSSSAFNPLLAIRILCCPCRLAIP